MRADGVRRDYLAQETVELRDKVSMELDAEVDAAYPDAG
jgi:2-methylcitrate dehydratase PrpD